MGASGVKTWREELRDGQYIDAMDKAKTWCEAVVIKQSVKKVLIHFRGWGAAYNEWLDRDSDRLAPAYTQVKNWRVFHRDDAIQVGTVMSGKKTPVWSNATVRQVRYGDKKKSGVPAQVQVELDDLGEKRWVDAQDDLLCPAGTHNVAQVRDGKKTSPVKTVKSNSATTKRKRLVSQVRSDSDDDDEEEDIGEVMAKKTRTWSNSLQVGSLLEVADDDVKQWYEARVVCDRPDKISVRFRGWPWRYDEWVERSSKRLAPAYTHLGNWRAFDSFGYVQIGFRKSANEDTASHWVLGHVVRKFKNPATRVVGRVEIKWTEDDGTERSEIRDTDDDFLAPDGVQTYPPPQPPAESSDSDSGGERDDAQAGGTKTESDDESDEEKEDDEESEAEELFVIETNVAEDEQHDGDTTASTVSDALPDTRGDESATGSSASEKASCDERFSEFKLKLKEDTIEMYNRAMSAHLAMIDALEWPMGPKTSVETQTKPEPEVVRSAKRQKRVRGQDDERNRVWEGLTRSSKNAPAHV